MVVNLKVMRRRVEPSFLQKPAKDRIIKMASASTARIVEIFRQHEQRLKTYCGKESTEEGDLFIRSLLPMLDNHAGEHVKRQVRSKLGKEPARKYHLEHPNKALRKLCDSVAQAVESYPGDRITVPEDFLRTHCVTCPGCGCKFLAKRSDARYCPGGPCQKRFRRKAMSELIAGRV